MDAGQKKSPVDNKVSRIRNVGIIAHIDAGKTTLTERILYATNEIRCMGEVHEGTTVTDWMPQERERGVSITAAAVSCHWKQFQVNIVDTPGHIDFTAEVERSLSVMDGVIAVFCAVRGVQAQSETVWRRAVRYRLPALAFINKMDRTGADPARVVDEISKRFGVPALPIQLPAGAGEGWCGTYDLVSCTWNGPASQPDSECFRDSVRQARERLIEALADVDDEVMLCYLEGREPAVDRLRRALRKAVIRRKFLPVLFGSALQNAGVECLLDALCQYMPSPLERRMAPESVPSGKASAQVFRVSRGPEGFLAYVRILSGMVTVGTSFVNARCGVLHEVSGVMRVMASSVTHVPSAEMGEIVALTGNWSQLRTGDVLVPEGTEFRPVRMQFPQPVVSMLVEAVGGGTGLPAALKLLAREDPTLRIRQDPATAAWVISGMGEFHLEIIRDRLRMDFGISTRAGKPKVEYVETVQAQADGVGVFEKRLYDGRQLKAEVSLRVAPLARGSGMRTDFSRPEAALPAECVQALRQGVASIVNADSSGCPLTDVIVTVLSASSDAGEAREVSLLNAARLALRNALAKGGRVVLEPVMLVEVNTPSSSSGNVIADLASRKARISSVESAADSFTRIVAQVPLAELFGYASSLRSLSAGRGEVVAEPAEYAPRATL